MVWRLGGQGTNGEIPEGVQVPCQRGASCRLDVPDHFATVAERRGDDRAPYMGSGFGDEDHHAAPRFRLTHTYLSGYTSINIQ
jgi:hypothetical protein